MANKPRFSRQVGSPIEVLPAGNAENLGRHYSNLHEMQTDSAYRELGEGVSTRFQIETLPDGTEQVIIIEDHH